MRDLNHPKRPSTQLHNPHLCWLNHHLPMGFPMVFPWFPKWFFDVCPMFFRWFFYVVPMVFLWFPFFYVVPMVFYGFLWFFYGFPAKKKTSIVPHEKSQPPAPPGYVPPPPGTRSSHSFEANAVARTSPGLSPGEP